CVRHGSPYWYFDVW
nr:immunoglobulin heavy chain junction region [Mus musculus]MBK4184521.1 immunoglobulin heavy chain junction region [Mus musculus]MBK4184527.1 immunoglobulin heavy chain junction region [Mus musculus]